MRHFWVGGVDMINDLSNSGVALAVAGVAKEKRRHAIVNNASNVGVTNAQCSPYAVHYTYDAYSLAHGTGKAIAESGGDTWFFLTVDFAFGIGLEQQVSDVVRANKGRVVGAARHPLGTTDFSSYVLQAQASRAKIVGLASTGNDTINAIKAANEFGITQNQKLAALLLWIQDVHALGLPMGLPQTRQAHSCRSGFHALVAEQLLFGETVGLLRRIAPCPSSSKRVG